MREALRGVAIFPHEFVNALSMPIGAGVFAQAAVEVAGVEDSDRVVDVGCGPGTASRVAARRGAEVFGVDPTPLMLTFARMFTGAGLRERIAWLEGLAESIPLDDGKATVALAIRSAHHFDDPTAAFSEMRRVLAPGGRVVIVERAVGEKAWGHSRHGFSPAQAREMAADLEASGFDQVKVDTRGSDRRGLAVLSALRP
jgi:ubiquinone/menaquinone biosynthesis C-methylase UbiE